MQMVADILFREQSISNTAHLASNGHKGAGFSPDLLDMGDKCRGTKC